MGDHSPVRAFIVVLKSEKVNACVNDFFSPSMCAYKGRKKKFEINFLQKNKIM